MIKSVVTTITFILALLHHSLAFDPTQDRKACKDGQLCLTSFKWCASPGYDDGSGCTYPPNAYRLFDRGTPSNPAGLVLNQEYNLTWANADSQYPVLVEWSIDPNSQRWARNITDSHFIMRFGDMIRDFANSTHNTTTLEALGRTVDSGANIIYISQPERPAPAGYNSTGRASGPAWSDTSDQFIIISDWSRRYIETAKEITSSSINRKWRLGVGIGVGLGVPIFMAAAFGSGWLLKNRKREVRPVVKHSSTSSS